MANGTFKQGSGKMWMNNLQCWGTEDDIGQCQFSSWENSHCNHGHDVGLACGRSTNNMNYSWKEALQTRVV